MSGAIVLRLAIQPPSSYCRSFQVYKCVVFALEYIQHLLQGTVHLVFFTDFHSAVKYTVKDIL